MPFRLTVEDVFSIAGRGTVITGTVAGGSVSVGDELALTSQARRARITFRVNAIEKRRRSVDRAEPGDQIGLLVSIAREQAGRGDVIAHADRVEEPASTLAQLRLNADTQIAPLVLLPARVETRFVGDGLRIRVYPDMLHSSGVPRALSPADVAAGKAYLNERGPTGEAAAMNMLTALLGVPRATYVAKRARAGTLAEESPENGRLTASNLPHRFIFHVVEQSTQARFSVEGETVDPNLPLLPGEGDLGFALSRRDPSFWLRDFDTAMAKGMAAQIALPAGLANAPESRFSVFVFGLCEGDGRDGSRSMADLFERLADTRGLDQIAPCTDTKGNSAGAGEAFAQIETSGTSVMELDRALGLEGSLPARIRNAPDPDRISHALFTVLWHACLRPMAIEMLGQESQTKGLRTGRIDRVGEELANGLRPFGLPQLKAGQDLLGVLPVRWQDDGTEAKELVSGVSQFARSISGALARTADALREQNSAKPVANRLVDTLMRAPIGQSWRRRLRWFAPELASAFVRAAESGPQGRATVDAVRRAILRNDAKLSGTELAPAVAQARAPLPQFIGSPFADLLCGPLVARDALSIESGALEDPHIARLVEDGGALRDGAPADSADSGETALPILSTLVEDALLVVLSDIAAMVDAGGDTDRAAQLLEKQDRVPSSPRPELVARLLAQMGAPGDLPRNRAVQSSAPDRARHLSQLLDAVRLVQSTPPAAVHLTLAALIDCFSTRFDAWTDLDVRRTVSRQRGRGQSGAQIGTWAYVEGLQRSSTQQAQYALAPTTRLARLAGLMMRANEAIAALGMEGAATSALDSTRVALARRLIGPLAQGEELEDILARLVLEELPANRQLPVAKAIAASLPRSEDEAGKDTPLRFSALKLIDAGASAVRGLDPSDRAGLEAGLAQVGNAIDALADIALAEGALNLAEARPEAAQAALAQRSAGATPQTDPRSIDPLPDAASLSFTVALTGRADAPAEDLRSGLAPALADIARRLIGPLAGTITLLPVGDGAPIANPQRELAALEISPLGLSWLAASDVPTGMMLGTLAAMREGVGDAWIAEPDEEAEATLWAAASAHAAISAARSLTPRDFEGEEGLEGAMPALDEALLQDRVANARRLLSELKTTAERAATLLAAAADETERTAAERQAGWVVADCLAAGIITGGAGMKWDGLLSDAITAITHRLATAEAAPEPAKMLETLLGDLPVCLPLGLPAQAPWIPRRHPLSGADRDALFGWMEVSQRVRERLGPSADLLLARPDGILCETVQWPPPRDEDAIDWIGGPRRHDDAYHSRASLIAFGSWEPGNRTMEGLLIDAWQETAPDLKQTAALAIRTPIPSARAPRAILLAPAPHEAAWRATDVQAVIEQAIANAKMRALDLTDLPTAVDAGSQAGDLGGILPAIATISPGSALVRSLCETLPEPDR